MQRILIVDDEPNIVEGLYQLFQSFDMEELDICKAYSGKEAYEFLESVPVDLVLCDIAMPGMSGLQLLQLIEGLKLTCRIIFLTGYDKFEYIHTSIKSQLCASYILKLEGDEAILAAVKRELKNQKERFDNERLLERARKQMELAMPLLKMQYLKGLITGEEPHRNYFNLEPEAYKLGIDVKMPLVPILAWLKAPESTGLMKSAEQALLLDEIMTEEFQNHLKHELVIMEDMVVWLTQDKEEEQNGIFSRHMKSILQSVQNRFYSVTGISVSFAHSERFISVSQLPDKFYLLQLMMRRIGGVMNRMMIIDENLFGELPGTGMDIPTFASVDFAIGLKKLEHHLMYGRLELFEKDFLLLFKTGNNKLLFNDSYSKLAIISMYLSVIERLGLSNEFLKKHKLDELFLYDGSAAALIEKYLNFGKAICAIYNEKSNQTEEVSIERVKQYIHKNIGEKNLSLAVIASMIHYNPSYLSRFFKQKTGQNILEYINDLRIELSRELLADISLRVSDVAYRIGFESSSYFTIFFKKRTGITPNEYRNSLNSK